MIHTPCPLVCVLLLQYGSLPYFDVHAPDPTNPPSVLTHTVPKQTQGATFGELAAQVRGRCSIYNICVCMLMALRRHFWGLRIGD